jgi:hypothetical protein
MDFKWQMIGKMADWFGWIVGFIISHSTLTVWIVYEKYIKFTCKLYT